MSRRRPRRRGFLKAVGALGLSGIAGIGSGRPPGNGNGSAKADELRLFSEVAVDGSLEVVTQTTWAYVATGDGFAVVDWRNPTRPELVDTVDAPGSDIADVKVEGDLLAASSETGETDEDIGTHFYDVSDPTDPQFLGTWVELPRGVHNAFLDGDVAYITREFPFDDSAIKIVDVGDPTNPTLLSEWRVEDVDPGLADGANFVHDVYVQDDLAYLAYWDAGCRVLDVSDPADPVEVSSFGEAGTNEIFAPPGNAHYVQPSPDGDQVYVGAETFSKASGGIKVFDVTDLDDPRQIAKIEAEDRNPGIFPDTSHNFDVTANRLYTSWYNGGVRLFDVTDPANPEKTYEYDPDGSSFWTAVRSRGFTVASDIGGGLVFLHADRGKRDSPGFDGADAIPHHDRKRGR